MQYEYFRLDVSKYVVAADLASSKVSARLLLEDFNWVPVIDDNLNNITAREIITPNPSMIKKIHR